MFPDNLTLNSLVSENSFSIGTVYTEDFFYQMKYASVQNPSGIIHDESRDFPSGFVNRIKYYSLRIWLPT